MGIRPQDVKGINTVLYAFDVRENPDLNVELRRLQMEVCPFAAPKLLVSLPVFIFLRPIQKLALALEQQDAAQRHQSRSQEASLTTGAAIHTPEDVARIQLMSLVKEGRISISQAVDASKRHMSAAVKLALAAAKSVEDSRRLNRKTTPSLNTSTDSGWSCWAGVGRRQNKQTEARYLTSLVCLQRPCLWQPL